MVLGPWIDLEKGQEGSRITNILEFNFIALIDIRSVRHIQFLKEKYPFEIETFDHEKYMFSSKAQSDQESWY